MFREDLQAPVSDCVNCWIPDLAVALTLHAHTDGTLLHYPLPDEAPPADSVLYLPASKTGRKAIISKRTLQLAYSLRQRGVRLGLISGVRGTTFEQRLAYLPQADFYVVENGGRVFYPTPESLQQDQGSDRPVGPEFSTLSEDMQWRQQLVDVCGPPSNDALDAADRQGPLWDLYRSLIGEGWKVDTASYYTMLRVVTDEKSSDRDSAALTKRMTSLPSNMAVASNMGFVDITPRASGKKHVSPCLYQHCF